jgi:hypothetical protein
MRESMIAMALILGIALLVIVYLYTSEEDGE